MNKGMKTSYKDRLYIANEESKNILILAIKEKYAKSITNDEDYTYEEFLLDMKRANRAKNIQEIYYFFFHNDEELPLRRFFEISFTEERILQGKIEYYINHFVNPLQFYISRNFKFTEAELVNEIIEELIPLNREQREAYLINQFLRIRVGIEEIKTHQMEEILEYHKGVLRNLMERCYIVLDINLMDLCNKKNCNFIFDIPCLEYWNKEMEYIKQGILISEETNFQKKNFTSRKFKSKMTQAQLSTMFRLLRDRNIIDSNIPNTGLATIIQTLTGGSHQKIREYLGGLNATHINMTLDTKEQAKEIQDILSDIITQIEKEKRDIIK